MTAPAGSSTQAPSPQQTVATSQLRRLHPLTPVFRSWRMIGAAVAVGFGAFRDDLDRLRFFWDALQGEAELSLLFKAAAALLVVAVVAVTAAWWSWRATGFAIVDDTSGPGTLLYHRGLVVRQRSQVRLSRVQSVDVNQPVVARLCGLAVVRLEMAAGEDASVALAYLGRKDAWAVREEIIRHTSAGSAFGDDPVTRPADELVATVSTSRLIQANLLDGAPVLAIFLLWLVLLVGLLLSGNAGALAAGLAAVVPVTLAILVQLRKQVASVLRDADFRLYRTPRGIRTSAGLTSTINRTIDADRIQGVRIEEPLLWRRLGWARVEVDVAGAADSVNAASLMPVTDRADAVALVKTITGVDLDQGDVRPAGVRASTLDPLGARFLGVVLHERGAVSRRGRWRRVQAFVPYARVQSVSAQQGWLQRRLGLASVYLDMPVGVERWPASHRDVAEAATLVGELAERAGVHRAEARWVGPPLWQGSDSQVFGGR